MTQEALKLALEALELCNGAETVEGVVIYTDKEITAIKEALAEHAMRETQRLGQEIEQEPFGYFKAEPFGWTDCADTDEGAIALYQAPPQRTEQNFCPRCGKRTKDIHTCTPPWENT